MMKAPTDKKSVRDRWTVRHGPFVAFTLTAVIIASIFITLGWVSGSGDRYLSTPQTPEFPNIPQSSTPPISSSPNATPSLTPSSPSLPSPTPSPPVVISGKSKGSPNAPVIIINYSDFQCGRCQQFTLTIEKQLETMYIETGKVFFIYKHLIVFNEESQLAAEASEAAAEQGKFWPYYYLLMQLRASPKVDDDLSISKLQSLAQQVGLDMGTFNASLESGKYREKVRQEHAEGRALGVTGSPTFFINGIKKDGASSFEELQTIIDDILRGLPDEK